MTHCLRQCLVPIVLGLSACAERVTIPIGAPCGRNQHALATIVLPDTGINAGREILVGFIQHDPDLSGELSEVVVQQRWPSGAGDDSEADRRVRLVGESGQVFVDEMGTRHQDGTTVRRLTWIVLRWIKDGSTRNALYDSFTNQALWLELWKSGASAPGTRVRLKTQEFGVYPPTTCV
jgi:hypothetical protein